MNPGAEWLDAARRLVDVVKNTLADVPADPDAAAHGADCRWCPLCQAAAIARGERPEVSAALADLLTTTSAALRAFAEPATAGGATAEPEAAEETEPPFGDPPPTVQRIEIA